MNKVSFRLVAIAIAAATILVQSLFTYTSARALPGAAADVDITSEKRSVDAFGADLTALLAKCKDLAKKQSITASELNSAKATASGLKSRVSQAQQAFRSVVDKLKAAGLWDNLDSILPQITDAKAKRIIAENGGSQRILEEAASQLIGLSQEIDLLVQPLGAKVRASAANSFEDERLQDLRSRVVHVTYNPPAPMTRSVGCLLRTGIYRLNPTSHNFGMLLCICNPTDPVSQSGCPGGANFVPR